MTVYIDLDFSQHKSALLSSFAPSIVTVDSFPAGTPADFTVASDGTLDTSSKRGVAQIGLATLSGTICGEAVVYEDGAVIAAANSADASVKVAKLGVSVSIAGSGDPDYLADNAAAAYPETIGWVVNPTTNMIQLYRNGALVTAWRQRISGSLVNVTIADGWIPLPSGISAPTLAGIGSRGASAKLGTFRVSDRPDRLWISGSVPVREGTTNTSRIALTGYASIPGLTGLTCWLEALDGTTLTAPAALTVSGTALAGNSAIVPTGAEGATLIVVAQATGTNGTFTTRRAFAMPYTAPYLPTIFGMNRNAEGYYQRGTAWRDLAKAISWKVVGASYPATAAVNRPGVDPSVNGGLAASVVNLTRGGFPAKHPDDTSLQLVAAMPWTIVASMLGDIEMVLCDAETDAPWTGGFFFDFPAGDKGVTLTTGFYGAGRHKVHLSQSDTWLWQIRLDRATALPANGLKIVMRRHGDTSELIWTDEMIGYYRRLGVRVIRLEKMLTAEEATYTGLPLNSLTADLRCQPGDQNFGFFGPAIEDVVQFCNITNISPWICVPTCAAQSWVAAICTYVRDHLAPGLTLYLEPGNEVWNWGYPRAPQLMKEGFRRGLGFPSATYGADNGTWPATGDTSWSGGTPPQWVDQAWASGALVLDGSIYQAKAAISPGTIRPQADGAQTYWALWQDATVAKLRAFEEQKIACFTTAAGIFSGGNRSRLKTISGQWHNLISVTLAQIGWGDSWRLADMMAVGVYYGLSAADYAQMSSAEQAACTPGAGRIGVVRDRLHADMLEQLRIDRDNRVALVAKVLALGGALADVPQLVSYESGDHDFWTNHPDQTAQALVDDYIAWTTSSARADQTTEFYTSLAGQRPGLHNAFVDFDNYGFQQEPVAGYSNLITWGFSRDNSDLTALRYLALRNVIVAFGGTYSNPPVSGMRRPQVSILI